MRITIDTDSSTLEEVIKLTGEKKKGPAVTKAATEFVPVGHRAPDQWECDVNMANGMRNGLRR